MGHSLHVRHVTLAKDGLLYVYHMPSMLYVCLLSHVLGTRARLTTGGGGVEDCHFTRDSWLKQLTKRRRWGTRDAGMDGDGNQALLRFTSIYLRKKREFLWLFFAGRFGSDAPANMAWHVH